MSMKQTENKQWTVYGIEYQGKIMYVGKTCDFKRRVRHHMCNSYRGTKNSAIPTDVDLNEIEIVPIETFSTEADALRKEDELMQAYDTINTGWNKHRSGLVYSSDSKAYRREYQRERYTKEEYRDYQRNYQQSEKYKAYKREYEKTEKRKLYKVNRRQTPEYKAYQREYMRQYRERKKLINATT